MISLSLNVDPPFRVETLSLDTGERFLVIRCDQHDSVSIILPGRDADAALHASVLSALLSSAADALLATPSAEVARG